MPKFVRDNYDILADWSDCEEYHRDGVLVDEDTWTPKPEDVVKLYAEIAEKNLLELKWKAQGRRDPTDNSEANAPKDQAQVEEVAQPEAMEFDEEEDDFTPQLRPIGRGSQKVSQKKSTATLENILSNMARHMIADQQAVDNETGGDLGMGTQGTSSAEVMMTMDPSLPSTSTS